MNNSAATTKRDQQAVPDLRRSATPASEWMRWNDVATATGTLRPPLDLGRSADPSQQTETSERSAEAR